MLNDNLNVFIKSLELKMFLKERELESIVNSPEFNVEKLENALYECAKNKQILESAKSYFNNNINE